MFRNAALHPQCPVEIAVADGFLEVGGADGVGACEVGDGAGDAEDTIAAAGAKLEFLHGHLFVTHCRDFDVDIDAVE
jgi:hypothetical protein